MDDDEEIDFGDIGKMLEDLAKVNPPEKKEKNPLHAQTIVSCVEQYMSPFVIFGYDINGDALVLDNMSSQQDVDAIMLSIGRYMSSRHNSDPNEDIGDLGG